MVIKLKDGMVAELDMLEVKRLTDTVGGVVVAIASWGVSKTIGPPRALGCHQPGIAFYMC